MTRYFAIGDLHGHFDEFQALLEKLRIEKNFDITTDHLLLLGDLVDNGPKSKDIVSYCIELLQNHPETFHPLQGNHDEMFVDACKYGCKKYQPGLWYNQGGQETLKSYGIRNKQIQTHPIYNDDPDDVQSVTEGYEVVIPRDHLNWLEKLPRYYQTDRYFFCHAGLPPFPLSEIDLDDPTVQDDLIWIRGAFYASNIDFGKKVIFAHTPFYKYVSVGHSTFEPFEKENMIGVNTMPRNDGKLTCVVLSDTNDDYDFVFQEKL